MERSRSEERGPASAHSRLEEPDYGRIQPRSSSAGPSQPKPRKLAPRHTQLHARDVLPASQHEAPPPARQGFGLARGARAAPALAPRQEAPGPRRLHGEPRAHRRGALLPVPALLRAREARVHARALREPSSAPQRPLAALLRAPGLGGGGSLRAVPQVPRLLRGLPRLQRARRRLLVPAAAHAPLGQAPPRSSSAASASTRRCCSMTTGPPSRPASSAARSAPSRPS